MDIPITGWRKSRRSAGHDDNCVEVGHGVGGITGVRDSKDREGPVLRVADPAWLAFLAAVRAGRFDTVG